MEINCLNQIMIHSQEKLCCRTVLNLELVNPLKFYIKFYVCVGTYIFLERKPIHVMNFSTQKTKYLAVSLNSVVNPLCDFNPKLSSRI